MCRFSLHCSKTDLSRCTPRNVAIAISSLGDEVKRASDSRISSQHSLGGHDLRSLPVDQLEVSRHEWCPGSVVVVRVSVWTLASNDLSHGEEPAMVL